MRTVDIYLHCELKNMFPPAKNIAFSLINKAKQLPLITHPRTIPSFAATLSPFSAALRTTVTMNKDAADSHDIEAIFQRKHLLRSKIRKQLKNMDPIKRSEEDNAIQSTVVEAPWFKASKSLCAYISCGSLREVDTSRIVSEALSNSGHLDDTQSRKKLYVPRVEDKNSNMRMLKISGVHDLIENSINSPEPALVDSEGNEREDVMQASEPVDLVIVPGLAFDRSGGRLGRSGGYYDLFLKKYQELAKERKWKQPLLVALSYSLQIMEKGVIPVTPYDVPVDAFVSPAGFIPISPAALECATK
ncbi:5-formyltetrahydrofolate cyclo-ligase, mitochondrial [Jatropha curcas]|uniref:5-formyltetrahydrofolate cyclo-ligase, mitochondrial n=1 Tax=Jatropha curcas TaxID=180498 RepID=UPI0005FB0647|nr:5-formyltetrahydrofolate cyclo-ligase, mitochondrial [Jatropha curcas]